jgi:hypothetical protein
LLPQLVGSCIRAAVGRGMGMPPGSGLFKLKLRCEISPPTDPQRRFDACVADTTITALGTDRSNERCQRRCSAICLRRAGDPLGRSNVERQAYGSAPSVRPAATRARRFSIRDGRADISASCRSRPQPRSETAGFGRYQCHASISARTGLSSRANAGWLLVKYRGRTS